ncbi:hypothetical protein AOLI_G00173750 [Acnodon oligacanthus]
MSMTEGADESTEQRGRSSFSGQEYGGAEPEVSLLRILNELKDFRHDSNQQLADIKQELNRTNTRLEQAEERIGEAEMRLQAEATLIQRLLWCQTDMEAKLTDQEGRSRRDNLRINGISEEAKGKDMVGFLENLLKRVFDFQHDEQLRIERAHRALVPKPTASQGRPREYIEAKKVLKEKKIKFQTPYPARLRVFYEEGTRLYKSAAEATRDMASQGFSLSVVKPSVGSVQEEVQLLAEWQVVTRRPDHRGQVKAKTPTQAEKTASPSYREKLREFRHRESLED